MLKCKITVLDCRQCAELVHQYMPGMPVLACHCMKVGDVFITEGPFGTECPSGFCANAWDSIADEATVIASGGMVRNGDDDCFVGCCSDGARPVTFLLEPYFDDTLPPALVLPDAEKEE